MSTNTHQWALLLQIVARMDRPIPWAEIDVPEGRTQKGCVVMLDKEKKKIREAMAAEGKELAPFKAKSTPKKRTKAADGEEGDEKGTGSPKKKKPTPRKKKATKDDEKVDEAEKTAVKEEAAAEDGDEELV
ncbi:hypothetical protein CLAFUW4_09321 [Fulvia fulva]|uniref:Uncharacterized protein n=1 Tax=Passalora fulva TaxID=5499 RepID=A0A9Q8PG92_PASFU|nr:uncharacterized protein CLAFUR5_09421 [Fulvia fulva]KAK4613530.1 hypothetical protein CLAFUR4_09327 [Fulvia fulva]KAK4614478.1 hypothetical protein CLAFUR0_09319 [Fulvia fulva]UJO22049.1 hypothetical protein CLAFUR5_09421 [Fulvia fulva]WPV19819.1 hypothetical protein CLAFUW4_09321 [Fulvia fulva]WPV35677.1 hypothetical protein CLAFUW7_09322 [Fulvia fulva]